MMNEHNLDMSTILATKQCCGRSKTVSDVVEEKCGNFGQNYANGDRSFMCAYSVDI